MSKLKRAINTRLASQKCNVNMRMVLADTVRPSNFQKIVGKYQQTGNDDIKCKFSGRLAV